MLTRVHEQIGRLGRRDQRELVIIKLLENVPDALIFDECSRSDEATIADVCDLLLEGTDLLELLFAVIRPDDGHGKAHQAGQDEPPMIPKPWLAQEVFLGAIEEVCERTLRAFLALLFGVC